MDETVRMMRDIFIENSGDAAAASLYIIVIGVEYIFQRIEEFFAGHLFQGKGTIPLCKIRHRMPHPAHVSLPSHMNHTESLHIIECAFQLRLYLERVCMCFRKFCDERY